MLQERYKLWLEHAYFDEETKRELAAISDSAEIEDRFYTDLEFGTGGLRGVIAAGTNRMNKYVIRKATQGLADFISEFGPEGCARGVAIAYDSRRYSQEFAMESALVLAKNGIKVYLFDDLRPTPELSFAVRYLRALAGIVITASHNPKEYNGYKVYWADGGQVPPDTADLILDRMKKRESWVDIEPLTEAEAKEAGLLQIIGKDIDLAYLNRVKMLSVNPSLVAEKGDRLRVVYTPLHGAGRSLVTTALTDNGFADIFVVPEQEQPDPEFSTAPYPNPEIPQTFDLARRYGEERNADILLASDPDADRLGVAVRAKDGSYIQLTGNQIGVLLEYYLLSQMKCLGTLSEKTTIVKTIASTDLADAVAASFGVRVENVLTGFKFIAEKEKEMEEGGWGEFLLGFEESYGYLAGDFVRDKDAVIAATLICEAALYFKTKENRSLLDVLDDVFHQYGYYMEDQISITLAGKEGKAKMVDIMNFLRCSDITSFAGMPIAAVDDYEFGQGRKAGAVESYPLTLPKSNVLRFSFNGGGFVMARPSGTEPKIKFYFSVKAPEREQLSALMETTKSELLDIVNKVLNA